jgi:phosphoribosylaminoimidazole-succinocarboxamide synthase
MTNQLIIDLAKRYIGVYEKITGKKFKAYKYPVETNIKKIVAGKL